MAFIYHRTIRFQDTDAAGVVYFANVLSLCHEAYESSLIATGIEVRSFFSGKEFAVPVIHASIDFFKPLYVGDLVSIQLVAQQSSENEFEIQYEIIQNKVTGKALTKHVCIDPDTRTRKSLPSELMYWLEQTKAAA
jgi:1,4-dihydroxy-2-naphthoyl-CoA hydrolase